MPGRVDLSRAQIIVFVVVDGQLIDGGQARAQRDERHDDRGDDEEQAFREFCGTWMLRADDADY